MMNLNLIGALQWVDGNAYQEDLYLNGKVEKQPEIELNKWFAHYLSVTRIEGLDSIKTWDWAQQVYKLGFIQIDRSDFELLKKMVEADKTMKPFIQAQLKFRFIEATNNE